MINNEVNVNLHSSYSNITFNCPECSYENDITYEQVSEENGTGYPGDWYTITCLECGKEFTIVDVDEE